MRPILTLKFVINYKSRHSSSKPFDCVGLSTLIIKLESCARCLSPRMALQNFLKTFSVDNNARGGVKCHLEGEYTRGLTT